MLGLNLTGLEMSKRLGWKWAGPQLFELSHARLLQQRH